MAVNRTGAPRLVLVLIDGARPDVLADLLGRGDLPNLARHVIELGGLATGATVFPSTTGVAYVPLLYGRYPGSAGVPGIRWLDRADAARGAVARWRAARSYCGPQNPWLNRDVAAGPSIFECLPGSIGICTPLTVGLRKGAHRGAAARALLGPAAHFLGTYASLDRALARTWIDCAGGDWRFLFVAFPGVDGITHLRDPFDDGVLDAYRTVDRALGTFIAALSRRPGPPPAFIVTSDHGASTVHRHCDIALVLESLGLPTVRHPAHVWRRGARAAVMISGNAAAHVYLEPRSGRTRPLTASEIPAPLLDHLAGLPDVRLAAVRDDDDGVVVHAGAQRTRIREHHGGIRLEPLDGDALGLGTHDAWFSDRALLALTLEGPLPDAPRQLLQLLRAPRSGDIVLAARQGSDLRGPWEIPAHRAGHGSLIAEHMRVPIAASVPLPHAALRTVDLMPTMLELLDAPVPAGLDGLPFSRLDTAHAAGPVVRARERR